MQNYAVLSFTVQNYDDFFVEPGDRISEPVHVDFFFLSGGAHYFLIRRPFAKN